MWAALASNALTTAQDGSGTDEPSRLLTPDMMKKLSGTDIDAATAQRVLDDQTSLATRAQQADAEMARRSESATGAHALARALSPHPGLALCYARKGSLTLG